MLCILWMSALWITHDVCECVSGNWQGRPSASAEPDDDMGGEYAYVWGTNVNIPDVLRAIRRFLHNYRSSAEDLHSKYIQLIEEVISVVFHILFMWYREFSFNRHWHSVGLIVISDCGARRGHYNHRHVQCFWPWPWSVCKNCSISPRHHPFVGYGVSRSCHQLPTDIWEAYWGVHWPWLTMICTVLSFRLYLKGLWIVNFSWRCYHLQQHNVISKATIWCSYV